ncbi:MAG: outer membrane beta-barrel protein [Saprospiraceae bacterium]
MKNLMKTTLFILSFIALCNIGSAQGKMFLGLDLGFQSSDAGFNSLHETSQFNVGPSFGYWLNDKSAVVVGVNFISHTNKTDDLSSTGFKIGAEYRYGWHVGDHAFLYLAPGVAFGSNKDELVGGGESKWTTLDIRIRPGISYMLADKWSINGYFGGLGYSSITPDGGDGVGAFGLNLEMSSLGFGIWYHF